MALRQVPAVAVASLAVAVSLRCAWVYVNRLVARKEALQFQHRKRGEKARLAGRLLKLVEETELPPKEQQEEILRLSPQELSEKLKSGALSCYTVCLLYLLRASSVDEETNSITQFFLDESLELAKNLDANRESTTEFGKLWGVPLCISEDIIKEGSVNSLGLLQFYNHKDPTDSHIVKKVREQGGIILFKTNVSQLLLGNNCFNPVYGQTANIYNSNTVAGGSAGGAAVCVASLSAPLAICTDALGSVVSSSHFCGVFGLRFSPASIPLSSFVSKGHLNGLPLSCGLLSAHPDGLAFLSDALQPNPPPCTALPSTLVSEVATGVVSSVRVGVYKADCLFAPFKSCADALDTAIARAKAAGIEVVECDCPVSYPLMLVCYSVFGADGGELYSELLNGQQVAANLEDQLMVMGMSPLLRFAFKTLLMAVGAERIADVVSMFCAQSVRTYLERIEELDQMKQDLLTSMNEKNIHFFLCPAFPIPAPPADLAGKVDAANSHNRAFSAMGFPTVTLPMALAKEDVSESREVADFWDTAVAEAEAEAEGLPVGVQLVGVPGSDRLCLQLARLIATPTSAV